LKTVYTIGHSNRGLGELIELLESEGVELVYDVRRFPGSRAAPHFSREVLSIELGRVGLKYVWDERLGGYRRFGRDVEDVGIGRCFKSEGFRAYATYMIKNSEARRACRELASIAEGVTTAIMCREKIPWRCHRKILSDYMVSRGFMVIHIIERGWRAAHRLTKCARILDGELTYI